jgi:hypothetical protein
MLNGWIASDSRKKMPKNPQNWYFSQEQASVSLPHHFSKG